MAELAPVTCAGCGLLCDDVTVERSGDGVRLQPPCPLGTEWFSEHLHVAASAPAATIHGQPAEPRAALTRAAELLRGARRPLLHGFDWATVEDARAAVALADRLGALVAPCGLTGAWPGAPALPLRGVSTATLGEIRDRSRLVVIWREDPQTTHPRLLERLGFGDSSLGPGRTLVVVDDRDTPTSQRADVRLAWPQERDLGALSALHALARRGTARAGDLGTEPAGLLERVDSVPHVAFLHGPGLTSGAGGQRRALALHELVRELCHSRHVVTLALPAAAGTRSAQDVLAWQTGYCENVDLASGHPELVTATAPIETAEGVDVALCIQGDPGKGAPDSERDTSWLPARAPAGVTEIALCSLPVQGVEVSIRTAAAGVQATGMAHRLDGVPLGLQAPFPEDQPTAAALLERLLAEIER